MKSRGINEFSHYVGPLWPQFQKVREVSEKGGRIVDPQFSTVTYMEISISSKELIPWLKPNDSYIDNLQIYDEDYWMIQEFHSIRKSIKLLKKVYDTFISRSEIQFYKDYCPIRWTQENDFLGNFDDLIDIFHPYCEGISMEYIGNFAFSECFVSPFIINQAEEYNEIIKHPNKKNLILWARKDFLRKTDVGLDILRCHRMMGTRALRFGLPVYCE